MSTLDIKTMSSQHQNNANGRPPATLEFKQAMKDFKTMFPTLDMELIECVLRSNSGRVDATVDQLLQLSRDTGRQNYNRRQKHYPTRRIAVDYDSTDSEDSFHSEFLDGPTSSDDDLNLRDPPPMYTPHAEDTAEFFPAPSYPADTSAVSSKPSKQGNSNHHLSNRSKDKKKYRAWNPPMLGTLPDDFLRILPQQFLDHKEKAKLQKSMSHPQRHQFVSKPVLRSLVSTNDPAAISQAFGINTTPSERTGPPPGLTGPAIDDGFGNGIGHTFDEMNPPPRPPRTIPTNQSRKNTQPRMWHIPERNDHRNSMIRTASDNHHHHSDSSNNSHRSRHHHHSRSSRQHHSSRNHSFQSRRCTNSCNHTRKSNDFTSRRMVMVSRLSEPALPISHNGVPNGLESNHTPSSNNHRSHRSSSTRNPPSHITAQNRHSPNSFRNELQWHPTQSGSSQRLSSMNSVRSRPRTSVEEEQYVEDCRLAILLQNEEFIRELKRNDEFLKELEKDRPNGTAQQTTREDRDKEIIASPDPDGKYTHGSREGNVLGGVEKLEEDIEKDDKAFKENLKHMSKSARKKFNELAKKFSVRRKSSYKAMKNIDPVFANCDDEFDKRRSSSPTFELRE